MSSQITIDVSNLKGLIKGLENLRNNIESQSDKMLKEIAESGKKYLDRQYKGMVKDPNIEDINTKIKGSKNNYELVAYGKDVVYEEFGTGDEGESHQHPAKSNYNLNPYNSGDKIRNVDDYDENSYIKDDLNEMGITSGKFWIYSKDGSDTLYYTQGVPAGKEMWNTRNYLLSKKTKEIIKKGAKNINENIIASIKS